MTVSFDFKSEREVVARMLVGSRNYDLTIPDPPPDYDFKLFVLPTFNDLYSNELYSTPNIVTKTVDYDIHDLRQLPMLLFKANINYLEVLFSEYTVYPKAGYDLKELVAMRDDIARMSLKRFYDSCIGTHIQKMNLLLKGTESTQPLVDKFGYDTKQASHAWRVLDAIERFSETDFTDFNHAIKYKDGPDKSNILNIKQGALTLDEFRYAVKIKLENTKKHADKYNVISDTETVNKVKRIVKDIVQRSVMSEWAPR